MSTHPEAAVGAPAVRSKFQDSVQSQEKEECCGSALGNVVAQMAKNPPAVQETRARSLGREDLLEKEMATLSSILAWRFPQTEEPGGLQSTGSQRIGHN